MDGRTISHEVLEHFRFSAIKLHRKNIPVDDIEKGVLDNAIETLTEGLSNVKAS